MANRLASESSPYLLEHAANPVDWYPWGDAAFDEARARDKPLFISIGYAACHWCHVMARESFEDPETARLMNDLFVNVKVDREERPEVDAVYMNAIQLTGEGGGWPLSAFCTPDGKPFYLGTYFPPDDRFGRPSFSRVLLAMADAYRNRRDDVVEQTENMVRGLRIVDERLRDAANRSRAGALDASLIVSAGRTLAQRSDPVHGGLGTRPKFPSSSAHELLARAGRLAHGEPARAAFLLQAKKMLRGGIYDHLGGGFARYSVDERWLVPHFEKMLYDNAQLLSILADAHAMTGEAEFARGIAETVSWLEREMQDPAGGFYASQDADSEGEEGKYYVWTPAEIEAVLGRQRAEVFCRAYGVTAQGNFESGTSVLSRVGELGDAAEERALGAMRRELFAVRDGRAHPATDTKVLAAWNGLAVAGLVRAWQATGNQRAIELAREAAGFLVERMLRVGGGSRLWRVYKDGKTSLDGNLDDFAFVARGFLLLAEATGEERWWRAGTGLCDAAIERFYEERDGAGTFYMTPADSEERLIHRPESSFDSAMPSGAAVAVECLLRHGLVTGDARAFDIAERCLSARAEQAAGSPFMWSRMLAALDLYLHATEVVVTEGEGREALLAAARRGYAPTVILVGPWAKAELLEGKTPAVDGRAAAYVCRGQSCSAPVHDAASLAALITGE